MKQVRQILVEGFWQPTPYQMIVLNFRYPIQQIFFKKPPEMQEMPG